MSRAVVHAIATLTVAGIVATLAGIVATLAGPSLLTEVEAHREYGSFHGLAPTEVVIDRAGERVPTSVFALAVVAVEPGSVVLDPPPSLARLVLAQEELFGSHPVDLGAEEARMSAWTAAEEVTGRRVARGLVVVGAADPPLREGDLVISVDGDPATRQSLASQATALGACLGVLRAGAAAVIDVPVGYRIGIDVRLASASAAVEAPFVEGLEGLTGPSSGLALALAYVRALTGRDSSHARRIGATGILEPGVAAGHWYVSAVGAAGAKAAAAAQAGLDAVLVPSANASEARLAVEAAGSSTQVVAVDSLEDAVRWMAGDGQAVSVS